MRGISDGPENRHQQANDDQQNAQRREQAEERQSGKEKERPERLHVRSMGPERVGIKSLSSGATNQRTAQPIASTAATTKPRMVRRQRAGMHHGLPSGGSLDAADHQD